MVIPSVRGHSFFKDVIYFRESLYVHVSMGGQREKWNLKQTPC